MTDSAIGHALQALKRVLREKIDPNTEITLFGSAARGDFQPDSDIDVLVLLPFEPDHKLEETIFDLAYEIELQDDVVFGILVHSKEFWNSSLARVMPIHRRIATEGVAI